MSEGEASNPEPIPLPPAGVRPSGSPRTEGEKSDQEPEAGGGAVETKATKQRALYSKLSRGLSEKDLSTPAARRFLLDEIDRLHQQVTELEVFRETVARKGSHLGLARS